MTCNKCGFLVPDYGKFCTRCGQSTGIPVAKRKRRSLLKVLLGVIGVFIFLVVLGSLFPANNKKAAAQDGRADITDDASTAGAQQKPRLQWITPSEIVGAYEANELAADKMYKGKKIGVRGIVEEISNDITDSPYVILTDHALQNGDDDSGGLRKVQAHFSDDDKDNLAQLRQGQQLLIACTVQGLMMHVQFDDCRIADPSEVDTERR